MSEESPLLTEIIRLLTAQEEETKSLRARLTRVEEHDKSLAALFSLTAILLITRKVVSQADFDAAFDEAETALRPVGASEEALRFFRKTRETVQSRLRADRTKH